MTAEERLDRNERQNKLLKGVIGFILLAIVAGGFIVAIGMKSTLKDIRGEVRSLGYQVEGLIDSLETTNSMVRTTNSLLGNLQY